MELKDRAKQKNERRNQKKSEPKTTKGPQIAWDEMVTAGSSDDSADGAGGVTVESTAEATSLRPDGPTVRPDGPTVRPDGPTRPDSDSSASRAATSSSAPRPAPRGSAR